MGGTAGDEIEGRRDSREGSVKTRHTGRQGGMLGRRGQDDAVMGEHGIDSNELGELNLEPLEQTSARPGVSDVDVLDGIDIANARSRDRLLEGVEVQHDQIDAGDAVLRHDGVILTTPAENAAVNLGMQRLDAAIHDLGEPGDLGHVGHRQAGLPNRPGGTAGAEDLDIARCEFPGQIDDAGLVGNTEQGAPHNSGR